MGRKVPKRLVPASDALAHRAYEEDRPVTPPAPRTHPQLFRAQKLLSSGVVEGLNNKAKVTMRKSYGFRAFRESRPGANPEAAAPFPTASLIKPRTAPGTSPA